MESRISWHLPNNVLPENTDGFFSRKQFNIYECFFSYLATSATFRVLAFQFMRGEVTVGKVIEPAVCKFLKRYEELGNMSNRIGKHNRIKAPPCWIGIFQL